MNGTGNVSLLLAADKDYQSNTQTNQTVTGVDQQKNIYELKMDSFSHFLKAGVLLGENTVSISILTVSSSNLCVQTHSLTETKELEGDFWLKTFMKDSHKRILEMGRRWKETLLTAIDEDDPVQDLTWLGLNSQDSNVNFIGIFSHHPSIHPYPSIHINAICKFGIFFLQCKQLIVLFSQASSVRMAA